MAVLGQESHAGVIAGVQSANGFCVNVPLDVFWRPDDCPLVELIVVLIVRLVSLLLDIIVAAIAAPINNIRTKWGYAL